MEEISKKDAIKVKAKKEAIEKVTLEDKPDEEVLALMKHREEDMRAKAVAEIDARLRGPDANPAAVAGLKAKLQSDPRLLVASLNSEKASTLTTALLIIASIMNDEVAEKIRQVGGIHEIVKLHNLPFLKLDHSFARVLLFVDLHLTKSDAGRDAYRGCGGLLPILHLVQSPEDKIRDVAVQVLYHLSFPEKNQVILVKGGALHHAFSLLRRATSFDDKIEVLYIIRNLAFAKEALELVSDEHFTALIEPLDSQDAYPTDETNGTLEYQQSSDLQRLYIQILYLLTDSARTRMGLTTKGLVPKLLRFFLPLSTQTGYKWNHDIFERALRLIDRLILDDNLREAFTEAHGLSFVAKIIEDTNNFPEDTVLTAGEILATLATNANSSQQGYADTAVDLFLHLLEEFPNQPFVQDLVSRLLSKVVLSGKKLELLISRGAVQILINFIKEVRVKSVLINSAQALAALCQAKGISESIIAEIMESDVVPVMVSLLQLNISELSVALCSVVASVCDSEEGVKLTIMSGGIALLTPLLESEDEETQEKVLLVFGRLFFSQEYGHSGIHYFGESDGFPMLIKLMSSRAPRVAVPCLSIVSALSQDMTTRLPLLENGIVLKVEEMERLGLDSLQETAAFFKKIKASLKKHEAELKKSQGEKAERQAREARELEAMRLAQAKIEAEAKMRAEEAEAAKNKTYFLKVEYEYFQKIFPVKLNTVWGELVANILYQFNIEEYDYMYFSEENDRIEFASQADLDYVLQSLQEGKAIQVVIQSKTPITKMMDPKAAKIDDLLKELTHKQLRELVTSAILEHGATSIIADLKAYYQTSKEARANAKVENVPSLFAPGTVAGAPVAGAPVTVVTPAPSSPSPPPPPSAGGPPPPPKVGGPPPPPPPSAMPVALVRDNKLDKASHAGHSLKPKSVLEELQQGGTSLRHTQQNAPRSADPDAFLAQIKGGNFGLKKVEIDSSYKPRGKEGLMHDIKNQNGLDVRLLDQSTQEGKKYWINFPDRYIEALHQAFLLDYTMIKVIWKLLESDETYAFKDIHEMLTNRDISQQELAEALQKIGFSTKSQRFLVGDDEEPTTEYIYVLQPADLPFPIIIKTILATIQGVPEEFLVDETVVEETTLTLSL
eukprot:TRINITY_DN5799_c0_g1_i1.p1 TRINITY_DN5799_c0_g1~~TRINITY_DN5799_c0_g1_i1.p1  ORF type:complete len:1179 (-),score=337.75 TRINITY_DN5799_c0_g1_i1:85-3459(-)